MKHSISLAWITKTGELIRVEVDGVIYGQDKINSASEIVTDGVKTSNAGVFDLNKLIEFNYKGHSRLFEFNDNLNYKEMDFPLMVKTVRNRVDAVKAWKLSIDKEKGDNKNGRFENE